MKLIDKLSLGENSLLKLDEGEYLWLTNVYGFGFDKNGKPARIHGGF